MSHTITPVARTVPHDSIDGMETSSDVQTGLQYIFNLFRGVMKEPTGFLNKYSDSSISFDNATRTFSIQPKTPTYTSFDYYIRGKLYTVSSLVSYQIPDSEGLWYFYFDINGALQGSQTAWTISDPVAFIATGYWDSTNKKWIRDNEERHGLSMDSDTHRLLHTAEGSKIDITYPPGLQIINYNDMGDGSLDSHAQYGTTNGTFFDEDLSINIIHSAAPTQPFEQILLPYSYLPVFYITGTDMWRRKDSTQFPFYENPPALPYYNMFSGGNWSLQPVTNGYFFATWHIYTDAITEPVMVILGQRQDSNVIEAVNNNTKSNLILPRKFSEEFYFFKKIIWEVSTSFTNTPKCRLRYIAQNTEVNAANDRYAAICNYNGNANTGRYLEFYSGQSSDVSPYPIPEPTFIKSIILSTVANSSGTVSFYKHTDLINPIVSIVLSNSLYIRLNTATILSADDRLVAKVSSGSLNKPAVTVFLQTNL